MKEAVLFLSGRRGDRDLLSVLLDEFPYLHLSTETLRDLWRKSSEQLERLANAEREVRRKKSKAQSQVLRTSVLTHHAHRELLGRDTCVR